MWKHLSAKTVCVALNVLPRGALRQVRKALGPRAPRAPGTDRRGHIPHRTPHADRPAEVVTRTMPGHWEGNHIKGTRNGSAVGSLLERTSRMVLLARLDGTDARSAYSGITKKLQHVLAPLRNPLTYDRGKESAEHERLTHQLAIQIFFTVPHSPWEHGTNEKPQEACYDSI